MMPHGTVSRYTNQRCRCDLCKSAFSVYKKEYRKTERGKEVERRGQAKYWASEKGKAYREANREKARECTRRWGRDNPERRKEANRRHILKQYGLTIREYDQLLAGQGDSCAACKTDKPGGRGWHVDHDHETSEVRGILCNNCNAALGMLQDSPMRVSALLTYISTSFAIKRIKEGAK